MSRKHFLIVGALLLALLLAACGGQTAADDGGSDDEPADCPTAEPCPECPSCPEVEEGPVDTVPFAEAWAGSGHADADAEAFRHWDEDDPAEVSTRCAKCHTSAGYMDFVGADGTEFGVVDSAHDPEQSGITCQACHNEATADLSSVVMPSGFELSGFGGSAICMQCHQGRESTVSVNLRIAGEGAELSEEDPLGYDLIADVDPDAVNEELGFANIHYYPAAASLFGSEAHGGYEFAGNSYQIRFAHVEGYTECIDCHNQHTLEVKVEECAACHGEGEPADYRMNGSLADYDGDGDTEEGMAGELEGLKEALYAAIQAYAADTAGTPIEYDSSSYPYWFDDAGERYGTWTPALLQAAYNYQMATKDPGAFAHNAKYHVALLYDSIEAMGGDVSAFARNDPGHFDGTAEAFRHWDEDGEVSASCARCHSATGLPTYLHEGTNISAELPNSLMCSTCHEALGPEWTLRAADDATFPSGLTVSFGEGEGANLCIQCHQGRESGADVDAAIEAAGVGPNDVMEGQRFINIHYFPAGVTLFGDDAQGAYEYAGNDYLGRFAHVDAADTCNECHNVHALEVNQELCANCHGDDHHHEYRMSETDFDGDGDTDEGLGEEVQAFEEALYAAIQAYAADQGNPIIYDAHSYPYFFNDSNGNGEVDAGEANYGNQYSFWTPTLLRAAFNYQYAHKDPGAFAHNGKFVIQVLYDSIEAVGGDVSAYTRPATE